VPPVATQTDAEQRGFKIHSRGRKERDSTGERKSNTLFLMLFNVNTHTDFWTSRVCPQCWPETTFSLISVLRPNVPSVAERAGHCLCP